MVGVTAGALLLLPSAAAYGAAAVGLWGCLQKSGAPRMALWSSEGGTSFPSLVAYSGSSPRHRMTIVIRCMTNDSDRKRYEEERR
jgi:hypothetical protein